MSSCSEKQAKLTERANALVAKLSDESKTLAADIQERAKEIDPDIDVSGLDVLIGADIDVSWTRTDFSLDLPEVKIVDQRWSLDLPQVTVRDKTMIFHTPSIRMKTVKTGEYPETTCRMVTKDIGFGIKIDVPECMVRWSPIYIDVPETFMEEQRIVMGVPEFRMDRTEFVLGVPEFTMKTQTFSLNLPQITVKNITVAAEEAKVKGELLSKDANVMSLKLRESFRENAKVELGVDVSSLFDCYQSELMQQKNDAMSKFESGVNLMQSTIAAMASNKIPDDNESVVKVKQSLTDLLAKRDEFSKIIQEKFVELGRQQQSFFEKLVGGV